VRSSVRQTLSFQAVFMGLFCALSSGFILTAHAGLRGPGKYCGIVVLTVGYVFPVSGHFITYISDSVKNQLRPYTGKAMQIDALEVSQLENPGDALVRKYQIIVLRRTTICGRHSTV